jgi:hypothetical protein
MANASFHKGEYHNIKLIIKPFYELESGHNKQLPHQSRDNFFNIEFFNIESDDMTFIS